MDESLADFNCDMIMGWDLLKELGILIDFSGEMMIWHSLPKKDPDANMEQLLALFHMLGPECNCMRHAQDAKHKPEDVQKCVDGRMHLA